MRALLLLAALGGTVSLGAAAAAAERPWEPPGLDARLPASSLYRYDPNPLGLASGPALRLRLSAEPVSLAPRDSWLRSWAPSMALGAAVLVSEYALRPPSNARWAGSNGFDDTIGDALRGGSSSARDSASIASDALLGGMLVFLVADWYGLRNEYGLGDSMRSEMPWLLGNQLATRVLKLSAGRERPFVEPCTADPNYVSDCDTSRNGNTSFYSGHSSNAAAIAGLLCARHLNRATRSAADLFACGTGVAGALATGILRITADAHYATDVLVGWASGALFGYLLPTRMHFRAEDTSQVLTHFSPVVGTRYFGLRYDIRF
jgi:membrane-associated phospholipid phosphatase